jgi:nucleotide-binding universal stress UspA family protein
MFRNILIAFDGSEHARRAARIAGNMARMQSDAHLWLVCAMDPPPSDLGEPFINELITERTRLGAELLQQARELIGAGVPVNDELLFGSPAESIMSVSANHNCDLIIMGTRGLGGLRGLLLGSQIHKVISLSEIPVLAVK